MPFYVTIAANMPGGSGYYEVHAASESEARDLAFQHCPDGRWSMMYDDLEKVHPLDLRCHGVIGGPRPPEAA